MSAPRDIDPHIPGPADEDDDPTGIRALLASLPDPGPMPPEVVRRISETLAAEQSARDARVWHEGVAGGYAPVTGAETVTPAAGPVTGEGATIHPIRPSAAGPARNRTPLRRLPAIAIAASVVVLAGALVLGLLASQGGLTGSDSMDAAVQATMSGADARSEGDGDSAGGAAEDSAESSESESSESSESEPSPESEAGAALAAGPVSFFSSGAVLTTANLVGHARAVRNGTTGVVDESSRDLMTTSPVGTPDGAADCIGALLDRPPAEVTGLLTAVDFVRYDGADAVLIVVRDPLEGSSTGDPSGSGADVTEASTAYLVPVDCRDGAAWTLRTPVRLDP